MPNCRGRGKFRLFCLTEEVFHSARSSLFQTHYQVESNLTYHGRPPGILATLHIATYILCTTHGHVQALTAEDARHIGVGLRPPRAASIWSDVERTEGNWKTRRVRSMWEGRLVPVPGSTTSVVKCTERRGKDGPEDSHLPSLLQVVTQPICKISVGAPPFSAAADVVVATLVDFGRMLGNGGRVV